MCIYKEIEIYFKELAHIIVGSGNSEVCKTDQQLGDQEKPDVAS